MDADTIEYQDTLRREIEYRYPLLSEVLDLSDPRAMSHLSWNSGKCQPPFELSILVTKIKYDHLRDAANGVRIVRPDGNCFYRAYAMRLIEVVLHDLPSRVLADEGEPRVQAVAQRQG